MEEEDPYAEEDVGNSSSSERSDDADEDEEEEEEDSEFIDSRSDTAVEAEGEAALAAEEQEELLPDDTGATGGDADAGPSQTSPVARAAAGAAAARGGSSGSSSSSDSAGSREGASGDAGCEGLEENGEDAGPRLNKKVTGCIIWWHDDGFMSRLVCQCTARWFACRAFPIHTIGGGEAASADLLLSLFPGQESIEADAQQQQQPSHLVQALPDVPAAVHCTRAGLAAGMSSCHSPHGCVA